MITRFAHYLVYLLVRLFICFFQTLSPWSAKKVARFGAWFFTSVLPIRRQLVQENLTIAFPEKSDAERHKIAVRMWEHLFLMIYEVAVTGRKIRDSNWFRHIHLNSILPLLSLLNQDRPLIIVTGHFGNFEVGGYTLGVLSYPSYTVARDIDNPFIDRFLREFRQSTGQFLISKNDGYDQILEVLGKRGVVAFLADQSAGRKGCMVDFFGKPASTFKAIALLSLQYQAPIAVCYSLRRDNLPLQFEVRLGGILDPLNLPPEMQGITEITQWFTSLLEEGIKQFPEQYWWVHRRWKEAKKTPRVGAGTPAK